MLAICMAVMFVMYLPVWKIFYPHMPWAWVFSMNLAVMSICWVIFANTILKGTPQ